MASHVVEWNGRAISSAKKTWADLVIGQIKELNLSGAKAIVLAGKNYRILDSRAVE